MVDAKAESFAFPEERYHWYGTFHSCGLEDVFAEHLIYLGFSNLRAFEPAWFGIECTGTVSGYNISIRYFSIVM